MTTSVEITWHERRDEFHAQRDKLIRKTLLQLSEHLDGGITFWETAVPAFLESQQEPLLQELLDDRVLDRAVGETELNREQRPALRKIVGVWSPPLRAYVPPPRLETRLSATIAFSTVGAVIGILVLGPFTHWLLGFSAETGILIGGPLGAAFGAALLHFLTRHSSLSDLLQWALVLLGLADITLTLMDKVRPIAWLRAKLAGKNLPLWKRLLAYTITWVLLQLAKPVPTRDKPETQRLAEIALRQWMDHNIDLAILCGRCLLAGKSGKKEPEEQDDRAYLEAVRSFLSQHNHSGDPTWLAGNAQHFQSVLEARGYQIRSLDQPAPVFTDELQQWFEAFGRVAVGDPVVLLEPALLRGDKLLLRGVVQRAQEPKEVYA